MESTGEDPLQQILRTRRYLHALIKAHVRNEVGETRRGTVKWNKPPAGSFKLNFDAAIHKDLNGAGAGVVVRNNEGCCIRWSSKFFP
ncbi:UNVERIFIED_CONTAM: hypothetical protein Sradi_2645600 [Sesamum radiatum]|uniref:RNase H type-1 domain-containing protein n=1 Tax=Sesamum radiatum TaxID=300843 RepID=A0AAW2S5I9_SESRA